MSNLELKVAKKVDEKSIEGLVNESEITDKKMSAQELANYTRKKVLDLRNN